MALSSFGQSHLFLERQWSGSTSCLSRTSSSPFSLLPNQKLAHINNIKREKKEQSICDMACSMSTAPTWNQDTVKPSSRKMLPVKQNAAFNYRVQEHSHWQRLELTYFISGTDTEKSNSETTPDTSKAQTDVAQRNIGQCGAHQTTTGVRWQLLSAIWTFALPEGETKGNTLNLN